jgi:hypothetical protein
MPRQTIWESMTHMQCVRSPRRAFTGSGFRRVMTLRPAPLAPTPVLTAARRSRGQLRPARDCAGRLDRLLTPPTAARVLSFGELPTARLGDARRASEPSSQSWRACPRGRTGGAPSDTPGVGGSMAAECQVRDCAGYSLPVTNKTISTRRIMPPRLPPTAGPPT